MFTRRGFLLVPVRWRRKVPDGMRRGRGHIDVPAFEGSVDELDELGLPYDLQSTALTRLARSRPAGAPRDQQRLQHLVESGENHRFTDQPIEQHIRALSRANRSAWTAAESDY